MEVDESLINFLIRNAENLPRKTCRLCLHESHDSLLHQMIIVHHQSIQVPIHKHSKTDEIINVISGFAELSLYRENGIKFKKVKLGGNLCRIFRVPVNTFHSLTINSEWFCFQETVTGPFESTNTTYADI